MAGLPKRKPILLAIPLALLMLGAFATGVSAQTIQTPSGVIDPIIQTPSLTLQPMIDVVEANPIATDEQKQALVDAFTTAIGNDEITVDQAVGMLLELDWAALSTDDEILQAIGLVTDVLAGVASGEIDDPIAALIAAYNAALTPDGIVNAIDKAGATDETITQVEALVASGLPPGIVLRVTKDALRQGRSQEEIDDMLDTLAAAYEDGASAGLAANQATDNGSYKYEEQEQEENTVAGEPDAPEEEENQNGSRETSNGKGPDKATIEPDTQDDGSSDDSGDEPADEADGDSENSKEKSNNGNKGGNKGNKD